jgi:hypothetical protein
MGVTHGWIPTKIDEVISATRLERCRGNFNERNVCAGRAMSKAKFVDAVNGVDAKVSVPVSGGWVLVKMGDTKARRVRPEESVGALVVKAAKALGKPGIDRTAVFGPASTKRSAKPVYAYSVYAADPTKFVRESVDGTKAVGKMVNGKFKVLATS